MAQSHQLIQRDTQLIFSVMMKVLVAQSCPTLEFSRQEYWSGQPFSSPADLPDPGIEPRSPALQVDSLLWATNKRYFTICFKIWQTKSTGNSFSVMGNGCNNIIPHNKTLEIPTKFRNKSKWHFSVAFYFRNCSLLATVEERMGRRTEGRKTNIRK